MKWGMKTFFWYYASWYPHMILLLYLKMNPPKEIKPGDVGQLIAFSSLIGYLMFFGGIFLPVFGAESPYIVDVAPPLWAVQPFRAGDEGDELKIEAK